jgi:hypothetical protein
LVDAATLTATLQRDKNSLRFRLSWDTPTGTLFRHWYVRTQDEATAYQKLSDLRNLGLVDPLGDLTALVRTKVATKALTWGEALEPWITSLRLRADTEACHYHDLRAMVPPTAPFPSLDWFDSVALVRVGPRKGSPLSPTTARTRLRLLKSCARWHLGDQVPPETLRVNLPRQTLPDNAHPLTRTEARQLIEALPPRYRPVFVALLEMQKFATKLYVVESW